RTRVPNPDRDSYSVQLGERLRVARKGARMEPHELADRLGVPVNTYQKWERGERQFPMHLLEQFCLVTGFSLRFLVTGRPLADDETGPDTGRFQRPTLGRMREGNGEE